MYEKIYEKYFGSPQVIYGKYMNYIWKVLG
jgi:hypothetical protein